MTPPPVDDPFCITLLQAPPRRPQRKRITARGSKHAIPPLVWGVHYIRCSTPESLGEWLIALEREPSLIMIRGCPPQESARYVDSPTELKRAMTEVKSSWEHAAPIYASLSKVREGLKRLSARVADSKDPSRSTSKTKAKTKAKTKTKRNLSPTAQRAEGLNAHQRGFNEQRELLEREERDYLEALSALGWLARRKTVFREVPRAWVWLDLDSGLKLPETLTFDDESDHHAALRWIVECGLPPAFHEVSFVGQWSSNAFVKADEVKAHLAFLFEHPLGEGALKAWHGERGVSHWPLKWDTATFRTVQPHYTAAPLFVGIPSPLKRRTFYVSSPQPYVSLNRLSAMKLTAQGRSLVSAPSQESTAHRPPPVLTPQNTRDPKAERDRAASAPETSKRVSSGVEESASSHAEVSEVSTAPLAREFTLEESEGVVVTQEVRRALNAQEESLSEAPEGQRNQELYRSACHLGRYVGGGLLSVHELTQCLLRGAERCGLLSEAGEAECLRQILNGVRWGARQPIRAALEPDTLSLRDQSYPKRLMSELKRAIAVASDDERRAPVLALTCGGGKTTALCALMAEDTARGLSRVVFCRNHAMAREFLQGVREYARRAELNIESKIKVLEGVERHCSVLHEAPTRHQGALRAALAYGRRALCGRGEGRCDRARECAGSRRPRALKGGLTVATHAMGPLIEIPEGGVSVIDELPTPIRTYLITSEALKPLCADIHQLDLPIKGSFEAWRAAHPQLGEAARAVQRVLSRLADSPNLSDQDYGQALDEAESLYLFTEERAALELLQMRTPPPPPLPSASSARRGVWPSFPERGIIEGLTELARCVTRGEWPTSITVHWRHRTAWLEVRERYLLPRGPLVCLDGTAHRTEHLWASLVYLDRESAEDTSEPTRSRVVLTPQPSREDQPNTQAARVAEIWPIAAVGEPPLFARWVKTTQLRTSQLIRRGDEGSIYWRDRAVGSLKRIAFTIEQTAREARVSSRQTVGVLAAKHVADLFRVALNQDCDPGFDVHLPVVVELTRAIRSALEQHNLIIGHVGAHDVGSNLFNGVNLLAMLGSSKPDWGATIADLRALGIDSEDRREVYADLVSARDVQALARARHLRRRGVGLLYVGDMPPPVGHDLPDVRWVEVEPAHPRADRSKQRVYQESESLLFQDQWVSAPKLQKTLGVSRAKANALCQKLTRAHHLVEWTHKTGGRGRGSRAYGFISASPDSQGSLLDLIDGYQE